MLPVAGHILFYGEILGRAGEFGPEENFLVFGPACGEAVAAQGFYLAVFVFHHLEAGVCHMAPADAVLHIEKQLGVVRSGEGVTVEAHARSGGEFGHNAVAL